MLSSRPYTSAIYQSIILAGFSLVASYPVHAELMASNPKHASNSPISIDAILVCKKDNSPNKIKELSKRCNIENYINAFYNNDFNLSENDKFVIICSLLLVQLNGKRLNYDETYDYLITHLTQRREK